MAEYRIRSEKPNPNSLSLKLVEEASGIYDRFRERLNNIYIYQYISTHRKRIAHDVDIVLEYIPPNSKLLDIGGRPFLLTAALLSYGAYDTWALDLKPEQQIDIAAEIGLKTVKCNIETERIPFDDNYFDGITMNEVFEHLRINPMFTMREIFRVLKPKGVFTMSTPNLKSIRGMFNFYFRDSAYSCASDIAMEFDYINNIEEAGHMREYTPTEVCKILKKTGFAIDEIIYRGGGMDISFKKAVYTVFPQLRPFISVIAIK